MDPVRRGSGEVVRRPGGRTARSSAGITSAVTRLLADVGYANLTMDAIAQAAHVHRATLYRRWPSKEALVSEVLLQQAEHVVPLPDTGTIDGDLELLVASVVRNIMGEGEALLRAMVGEASRVPEVQRASRSIWEYRLGLAAELVRRGIDRGELPSSVDPEAFIEEMVAPIFFRLLVTGSPVDSQFGQDRVVRELALARL